MHIYIKTQFGRCAHHYAALLGRTKHLAFLCAKQVKNP
jgi:hypothetical protein